MSFWWALQLLFIGLKLAQVIEWAWWWVLAPAILTLMVVVVCGLTHRYLLKTDPGYALRHYAKQMRAVRS